MAENPLAAWLLEQERGQPEHADGQPRPSGITARVPSSASTVGDEDPPLWTPAAESPRSGRRLALLAALPWVVVALLALAVRGAGEETEPLPAAGVTGTAGADTTGPAAPTAHAGTGHPSPAPPDPSPAGGGPHRRADTTPHPEPALLQIGALLVRAALHGPTGEGEEGEQERMRYADHAVGIGVERAGGTAVVTVLALMLEGDHRGWHRSWVARYGIALDVGSDAVHALAPPWPLPLAGDDRALLATEGQEAPDRVEDVRAALARAGYEGIGDLQVHRPAGIDGVLIAALRTVPPGEEHPAHQEVWLRDDPRPVVLGHDPVSP